MLVAIASGMMLYGISIIYGVTGTLEIDKLPLALFLHIDRNLLLVFGLVFLIVGIAFKLGVVPFQRLAALVPRPRLHLIENIHPWMGRQSQAQGRVPERQRKRGTGMLPVSRAEDASWPGPKAALLGAPRMQRRLRPEIIPLNGRESPQFWTETSRV